MGFQDVHLSGPDRIWSRRHGCFGSGGRLGFLGEALKVLSFQLFGFRTVFDNKFSFRKFLNSTEKTGDVEKIQNFEK